MNRGNMTRLVMAWIRFAFTAPWSLLGWLWAVLNCFLFWTADYRTLRWEDAGIVTAEWRPWFAKFWKYSTTIGRAVIFYPGSRDTQDSLDERLEKHERIHVWQVEDNMFLSFLLGCYVTYHTGDWGLGAVIWLSGGFWQVTNFITALLRFGHNARYPQEGKKHKRFFSFMRHLFVDIAYRDSEHERSAYSQTNLFGNGQSWYQLREEQREDDLNTPEGEFERPM